MKKIKDLLIADDSKIITNGNDYGTAISLANNASEESYYEITEEEYENRINHEL